MTPITYCPVCGCRLVRIRDEWLCSALCDRRGKDGER